MRRSPLVVLLLALFGAIAPLRAQIARGEVVDSVTQVPLAQAVVALADQDGAELARTVTDDEGLFLLRAPAAGEFHLRVEAEGYRSSTFPPFALASSEMNGFRLLIASIAPPPPAPAIDELCPAGTGPARPRTPVKTAVGAEGTFSGRSPSARNCRTADAGTAPLSP